MNPPPPGERERETQNSAKPVYKRDKMSSNSTRKQEALRAGESKERKHQEGRQRECGKGGDKPE